MFPLPSSIAGRYGAYLAGADGAQRRNHRKRVPLEGLAGQAQEKVLCAVVAVKSRHSTLCHSSAARGASHRTRAGKGRSLGEKTSEMTTGKQPAAMAEYLTSDATPVRVGAKEARSAKGVVRAHERAH